MHSTKRRRFSSQEAGVCGVDSLSSLCPASNSCSDLQRQKERVCKGHLGLSSMLAWHYMPRECLGDSHTRHKLSWVAGCRKVAGGVCKH